MVTENITESDVYSENTGSDSGLEANVAGALAYVLGFLTGILIYVIDDRPEVRFHAVQSMLVSGVLFGVSMVFGIISSILFAALFTGSFFMFGAISGLISLVWLVVALASFGLWVYMIFSAYSGKQVQLPIVGKMAHNIVN